MEFFPAWAKVNLGLAVREKRPDGYHNVRMVMQTVSLADRIGLEPQAEGISLQVTGAALPAGPENLAWRAAHRLMAEYKIPGGVSIELEKHIPVAAGLAGGSADAAAVLYGLNRLFSLGLSEAELGRLALELGSDVPFALLGGTALAEGRGEVLTPLPPLAPCYLVLACPELAVATAWAYRAFDERPEAGTDIAQLAAAVRCGDLQAVAARLGNDFESVVAARYPVITELKETFLALGALGASLSGSGPTVFGLFVDRIQAENAARRLGKRVRTFVTLPVTAGAGTFPREAVNVWCASPLT
ncbi:MAG TPA: 4-(cytidine 5'-diphospho)-2-C-methyl-D-erythritol kinase [Firmicutes bacterium]|nr:4-(cytidine 5'-diphospho)-2-C-methyl-D-erythritol kinase [Bacillota bacterium]